VKVAATKWIYRNEIGSRVLISNPQFEPRRSGQVVPHHVAAAAASAQSGPGQSAGIDLTTLLTTLRERLWLILLSGIVLGLIGYAAGKILPPSFTAEGLMVMETQRVNIPDFQTVLSDRTVEPWGGRSEVHVITSYATVSRAVNALGLVHDPAFNAALRPSFTERLAAISWLPQPLRDYLQNTSPAPFMAPDTAISEVVERVRRNLKVLGEERSYAIGITYAHSDPVLAADIVNTIMDGYVAEQVAAKREATVKASQELGEKVVQLGEELRAIREEIRTLEAQTFVVESGAGTITAQNLLALTQERRTLEAERAALASDRRQIGDAIAGGRTAVLNASLVTPRLTSIWASQAEIQRTIADSAAQFGPRHPRMIALESELAGLRTEAESEVQGLLSDLDRRLASLNERAASLDAQIRSAEGQAATSAEGRANLNHLESEALSRQALLDLYRERYEQTLASLETFRADVRIFSRANPPPRPSSPGSTMLALVGGIAGLMLATVAVVARRYMGEHIHDIGEAVSVSGRQALGSVPAVQGSLLRRPNLPRDVAQNPEGAAAETLRGIILRMRVAGGEGGAPKVLMFTSAVPGDGKSSTVAAAARIAAEEGLRCLAIDADFRKASLASVLGIRQPQRALNDYFSGRIDLGDAVVEDDQSGAHFLFARPMRQVNRRLLEDARLQDVFDWARSEYDIILVDTPPVMRVIDPLVLAQYCDATVMIISWRSVKRATVRAAIQRLEEVGAPILGVVLTQLGAGASKDLYYSGYGKY
jgi:polysaccharide biosynthesis transport protein